MQVALWFLSSVAVLVFAGTVYQRLGSRRDRRIHTRHGR